MTRGAATLREIHLLDPGIFSGRLSCQPSMIPAPGQFVMAIAEDELASHPIPLFPAAIHADGFSSVMVPDRWPPGTRLDLMGPLGRGFSPPGTARRWLIASSLERTTGLMPLIRIGLDRRVELAYWGRHIPELNPAVEVVIGLEEGLRWADYAACEARPESLLMLQSVWAKLESQPTIQVLLLPDLLCGFGACQACATPLARGMKLACVDGPVFDASDLGSGLR
jgi:NAD(P)H-flavin reductase